MPSIIRNLGYLGQSVGVMHACGHDSYMVMLMGAAEVLSRVKADLPGAVKFIFQPAEEGFLPGVEGGAKLMVKEGVLDQPKVDAVFGVHIQAKREVGTLTYRSGGEMASSDWFTIKVHGQGAPGAYPWNSVDPVVTAAQIIRGLQTIVSQQVKLNEDAAVVTVGTLNAGVRYNVISPDAEMSGPIRALNPEVQKQIRASIPRIVTNIAESAGATAEASIEPYVPVTSNNPALTAQMLPTLQAVAGASRVREIKAVTGAEDLSFHQEKVPGLFLFVGGMTKGQGPAAAAGHTAGFRIDESGPTLGVKP